MSEAVDELQDKIKSYAAEKQQILENADRLRQNYKTLAQTKDTLTEQLEEMMDQNRLLKDQNDNYVLNYKPLSDFEKLLHELKAVSTERDSANSMLQQKDALLMLQSQQAEESIRLLKERQAALEELERNQVDVDEYNKLQESLNELFNREGHLLHSELIDAKRLTQLIRELKEKLAQSAQQTTSFGQEQQQKQALQQKLDERNKQLEWFISHEAELKTQIETLQKEVTDLRTAQLQSGASASAFPSAGQSLNPGGLSYMSNTSGTHHIITTNVNVGLLEQQLMSVRSENALLKDQLTMTQRELNTSKDELRVSHDHMQREFTTLWMSVQELNKLDGLKDRSIQDLIADRDRAINDKNQLAEQLKVVLRDNEELKQELEVCFCNL